MNLTERIAYIRGLADGLKLDENRDEVKVIKAMIDLLEDMAYDVVEMEEVVDEVCNQVDEIDEDLAEVEEDIYGDGGYVSYDKDIDEFSDDEAYYEVTCPACDKTTIVDEDALIEGGLDCPYCGAEIEFDFSELNEDIDALEEADKKADTKAEDKAEDKAEEK
ncbi:CD1247 N-terminal domain-containing protein [Roseburia sp. MSJ-14]|uniref:CD1247 N-terminal domain-containing protein n=1 Tax=Roseburia sp. MSJ-14 TaxID=2841514 RepID=UPI001C107203|nr:CD1247 N-terminal domain-containing protein [Roseburia sp. MSJ-14]MBU5474835.1 hypothetical protein [Roseburia sp. MSJ-14]